MRIKGLLKLFRRRKRKDRLRGSGEGFAKNLNFCIDVFFRFVIIPVVSAVIVCICIWQEWQEP